MKVCFFLRLNVSVEVSVAGLTDVVPGPLTLSSEELPASPVLVFRVLRVSGLRERIPLKQCFWWDIGRLVLAAR